VVLMFSSPASTCSALQTYRHMEATTSCVPGGGGGGA
jgi:hypothetical protein